MSNSVSLKKYICHKSVILGAVISLLCLITLIATCAAFAWEYMINTAECMPYLAALIMALPSLLWCADVFFVRNKNFARAVLIIGILFETGYAILCGHILSVLFFVLVEIIPILIAAILIFTAIFILVSHRVSKKCRIAVGAAMLSVFALYAIFGIFNLKPTYINADPVVFAVEDEYQIAWSTSATATACVEIGGEIFYESESGVETASTIHKVSVPREALDRAKSYTVISRGLIHRRTYLSTVGNEDRRTYEFCPVDVSDGLKFYNFSDNHMQRTGVKNAASYFGEDLDLIVANGDQFNNISSEYQVTLVYRTLAKISGSAVPVIMTRGNHETVGSIVDRATEFLPCKNNKFYYTVSFGETMFAVLDYATDHFDEDITTRPSHFSAYRQKELEWLKELAENKPEHIGRVVALCHISYLRLGARTGAQDCADFAEFTQRLGVNLLLCGHSHKTEFLKPGEGYNTTSYPAVLGSIRSDRYSDRDGISEFQFTGTAVEITRDGLFKLSFTNSKKEVKATYIF